jgi:flavin reductase (DIM6/NTAB) family NADH-FMN oxidoreductase RutF
MSNEPRNTSSGGIASGMMKHQPPAGSAAGGEPDGDAMRAARRRWASGIAVVTTSQTDDGETRFRGATIDSLQVASLEPPVVTFFLEIEGEVLKRILASGICAISVLDRSHEFLAERFAGRAPAVDPSFRGVPYHTAETGAPILDRALAWFDCRLELATPMGDHMMLVCRVARLGLGENTDDPLVAYEAGYRRLE